MLERMLRTVGGDLLVLDEEDRRERRRQGGIQSPRTLLFLVARIYEHGYNDQRYSELGQENRWKRIWKRTSISTN